MCLCLYTLCTCNDIRVSMCTENVQPKIRSFWALGRMGFRERVRADLALGTLYAHDFLTVGGILLQLQNSGVVFRIHVLCGLLLLNSAHERPPLSRHTRNLTRKAAERGEREQEKGRREILF